MIVESAVSDSGAVLLIELVAVCCTRLPCSPVEIGRRSIIDTYPCSFRSLIRDTYRHLSHCVINQIILFKCAEEKIESMNSSFFHKLLMWEDAHLYILTYDKVFFCQILHHCQLCAHALTIGFCIVLVLWCQFHQVALVELFVVGPVVTRAMICCIETGFCSKLSINSCSS